MSRRPARCFRGVIGASLAAIALTGCGDSHRAPAAPDPVASAAPAESTPPAPAAAPAPVNAPPVEAPPVASTTTTPTSAPASTAAPVATSTPPTPAAKAAPQSQQPDALQWLRDSEARKSDYQRRLAEAEADVVAADTNATIWQRNALAFKNPFLPRPVLSPQDAQTIAEMDGAERVRWSEVRLSEVRLAQEAAQKKLKELKANPPLN